MAKNTPIQDLDQNQASNTPGDSSGAMKLKSPVLALLAALSCPAGGQTMTLEEMRARLHTMQGKMQQMQAMQVTMEEMQRELDLLRERDANRQAELDSLVASSSDTNREGASAVSGPDGQHSRDISELTDSGTENILASMPIAGLGLHLDLPGKFSSNFHYAYTKLEEIPDLFQSDEMARAWAAHANLIYDYDPRLRVGVEYMWGEKEIVAIRARGEEQLSAGAIGAETGLASGLHLSGRCTGKK